MRTEFAVSDCPSGDKVGVRTHGILRMYAPRALLALAALAAVVAWWLLLRPVSLGGPATYVIVSGRSMEPQLRSGDLALVRKHASYEVGDLITFQAEGREVIHRIVGGDATDGFVVQGDNNPSPDIWRPRPNEIVGAKWFSVPAGGRALALLRQPANFAILMAALTALMLLEGGRTRQRRTTTDRSEASSAGENGHA